MWPIKYNWLKDVGNFGKWHRDGLMGETAYRGLSVGRVGREEDNR